jgi:hypothetical protein
MSKSNRKYTPDNKLWIGMYTGESTNDGKTKSLSYRMKVQERDLLKLEREADQWARSSTTQRI